MIHSTPYQTLTILRDSEAVEVARVVDVGPDRITIEGSTPAGGARMFDKRLKGVGYMDGFTARPYQVGDETRVRMTNDKYRRRYESTTSYEKERSFA
jgi:hypothetical protein